MNKFNILLLIAGLSFSAHAALYKYTDQNGETIYTDTPPFAGAEEMNAPTLQRTPAVRPKPKSEKELEPEKELPKYLVFSIDQPKNDDTIRSNEGKVTVIFKLIPELNTIEGHYIDFYVDGKRVKKKIRSISTILNNIDRGSHDIKAVVKNKEGTRLKSSDVNRIHIHRASKLHNPPPAP